MAKQGAFRNRLLLGLLCSGLACAALAAGQGSGGGSVELYRYVNDKGVTVIDRLGVPPEYIGKGYEVLNEQGRVVRTVPPAPSAEEVARRKADAAQASTDAKLLRLYTSVADVDRARERKMSELDGLSSVAKANLQSVKSQQASLQSEAAEQERAGRQVPDHLVDQLNNLKSEEQRLLQDIQHYQQLRTQAGATFETDRARLVQLLGESH